MTRFLTDDWFDQLLDAAADLPEIPGARADLTVVVADAPLGPVRRHLTVEDGRLVSIEAPADADDPLELSCPYDVAAAIVKGDTSVSVEFMRGAVKANGGGAGLYRILPLTDDPPFIEMLRAVAARTEF